MADEACTKCGALCAEVPRGMAWVCRCCGTMWPVQRAMTGSLEERVKLLEDAVRTLHKRLTKVEARPVGGIF